MSINELFNNETKEMSTSTRMLNGTAELTRISTNVAAGIIRKMEEEIDVYRERIAKSSADSKEMEDLLNEFRPWVELEEDHPLLSLSDETVEGMLKSQQSKRSRAKGKTMTLDNYTALMTATIAESLLREWYNKPKAAGFGNRRVGAVDYLPSELEAFEADQEALKKEIRNIQSKKSIAKTKVDFDENSEYYQSLLKAERMLKDLRVGGHGTTIVEVDRTKNMLAEKLEGLDIKHMTAADSKELLESIREMIDAE